MSKISLPAEIEKDMVAGAQANPAKFAPLYEHYQPHIRRFFAVKLFEAADIDDLTAQTFEKALKNISQFEWRGYPFSAWLYRIASNLLKDHYRAKSKHKYDSLEAQVVDIPSEAGATAHEELSHEWQSKYLRDQLQTLDAKQRKILYMKFFDGYTNRVIAERLGLTATNVSSIVHRLVKQLRAEMSKG
jgi:RNA polymerase sigma-70 factor (ECF subfamily)